MEEEEEDSDFQCPMEKEDLKAGDEFHLEPISATIAA